MKVRFLDLKAQSQELEQELSEAALRVISSGQFVLGPEVDHFETDFAEAHSVPWAIGCSSGTAALHLILTALGIGAGDEVITTASTFSATVAAILYVGAKPVIVDIDPDTWNVDPSQVEQAITRKTKAVIAVHLHGRLADVKRLIDITDRHSIFLVEDAAQAHLAEIDGQYAGGFGIAGAFSFYPGKNLGALGEGGAVVTRSQDVAEKVKLLRNWGAEDKYRPVLAGFNYRMDALQGALLRVKLKHLDRWTTRRQELAAAYRERLASLEASGWLKLPQAETAGSHSYHIFAVGVQHPDLVAENLSKHGIESGFHYPVPVHLQPAYAPVVKVAMPLVKAERFASTTLSLPLSPHTTNEQVAYVCDTMTSIATEHEGIA